MNDLRIAVKYFIVLTMSVFIIVIIVKAHSGGTDGFGGHWDNSSHEYHYHHGYSAHDHSDIDGDGIDDCPYDFHNNEDIKSSNEDIKSNSVNKYVNDYSSSNFINSYKPEKSKSEEAAISNKLKEEGWMIPILSKWAIPGLIVLSISLFVFVLILKHKYDTICRTLVLKKSAYEKEIDTLRRTVDLHKTAYENHKVRVNKEIQTLVNDMQCICGRDILHLSVMIPDDDYLDQNNLPCSVGNMVSNGTFKWGKKYTLFTSSSNKHHTLVKYHSITCRYSSASHPINAYDIKKQEYRYQPCAICNPILTNTDWVDKYLKRKKFLEECGIDISLDTDGNISE